MSATAYVPDLKHPDPYSVGTGSVLYGTGAPSNSFGNNGDIYVNVTTGGVYSKSGDIWIVTTGGGSGVVNKVGHGSPVGAVTPDAAGQFYTDLDAPALWQSTGLTTSDWTINWI